MPDVILSLIDSKSLDSILSMSVGTIAEGMESRTLRRIRPESSEGVISPVRV